MQKPRAISNSTILGLIAVHLAIALPLAFSLNIWADEASTLYTTQHGFFAAFQNAGADEKQAPLYFWILSLWRELNGSILFARLFSVVCSVAAITFFARFTSRVFESRAALLASVFIALHPFLFWASLEIRGYALAILLSVVLIRLFFDGFVNEAIDGRRFSQIAFVCVSIIALYTNYYLGFLLAGFFAALVVTKNWKSTQRFVLLMLITVIAFLPLAASVRSQFLANTGGYHESSFALEAFQILWHHAMTFLLPGQFLRGEIISDLTVARVWAVRIALVAIFILIIKYRSNLSRRTLFFGTIAIVSFICFFAAGLIVSPTYVALRHASPLFVPCVLFVASLCSDVFSEISERTTKILIFVGGMIVLASFSYSLTTLYPNSTKRGDWARIGEFIEQNESPGQPIVVFTTFDALALPYHYHGVNKILPDEKFFEFDQEAAFGTENSLQKQTEFVISEIPPDAERVWLAVNEKCLVTEACVPLENFVRANYTIEIEKEFYLEKLYLLKKRR